MSLAIHNCLSSVSVAQTLLICTIVKMLRRLFALVLPLTVLSPVVVADARAEAASSCAKGLIVFVIGDSLTVSTVRTGSLSSRLCTAGFQSTLRPVNGLATWKATEMLKDAVRRGEVGPVVVAALGTNDAKFAMPSEQFGRQVDAFLAAAGHRTVLWVNLRTRAFGADSVRLNKVLAAKARSNQRLVVLDWAVNPSSKNLVADGVHLMPGASVARAKFLTAQLKVWSSANK
jgi:hypothetical protein